MTTEEFTIRLQENQEKAKAHIIAILTGPQDFETVYLHLRAYVACKYFLEGAEMETDNLIKLGDISTEKLAELRRGGLEYADKSVGCTSVASSVTKKILLVLSLRKFLTDVTFDPDTVAETATVSDLAQLILQKLKGR